jgi:flagellar biosynthesis/type III secretory pathway protein FliH
MSSPTVKRGPKVCENPKCAKLYRPAPTRQAAQKYCCHPCAVAALTRWSRVLAGRKAAETKRSTRPERMQNAKDKAYRIGYSEGYEKGYEAAMFDVRFDRTRQGTA